MHNFGGSEHGRQTMWKCLQHSYNTPVGRIDDEILGSVRMKAFLHGLGLDTKETYSSVDGIGLFISPLQSAAAYNALSCGGIYTKPRFVDTVAFSDGSVKTVGPDAHRAMNESVAYALTRILRSVPGNTAKMAAIPEYEGYAGKTGSVKFADGIDAPATYGDGGSDAWFCSYTNGGYAVSVWCGYDVPNTSPRIPDSYRGQQEINRDLQILLNGYRDVPDWEQPETVEKLSDGEYRITDAQDLADTGISWANLDGYGALAVTDAKSGDGIPDDWWDRETSPWLSYYRENGPNIPKVIDGSVYGKLRD